MITTSSTCVDVQNFMASMKYRRRTNVVFFLILFYFEMDSVRLIRYIFKNTLKCQLLSTSLEMATQRCAYHIKMKTQTQAHTNIRV